MSTLQEHFNPTATSNNLRLPVESRWGTEKASRTVRVISISSGKGGVGKTTLTANIALALAKMNQRVLIIDADLGLGNIDLMFGLTPRFNLNHYFNGEQKIEQILTLGPGGVHILPAGSGLQQVTHLDTQQRIRFLDDLDTLHDKFDFVLIDTEAGISENATYFNAAAHDILLVATPDPAAITDTYALMKLLAAKYHQKYFKLVVNQVRETDEGLDVYQKLTLISNRCPEISIDYLGCIPFSNKFHETVLWQQPMTDVLPGLEVSAAVETLACTLATDTQVQHPKGTVQFFWNRFFTLNQGGSHDQPSNI
jgi:flagellar biosynthesis protein FlhG